MDALWRPDEARVAGSHITRFAGQLANSTGNSFETYAELHHFSVENREVFWSALWDYAGIVGEKGAGPYVRNGDAITKTRWFPEARLNYAENLLRRRDAHTAIIGVSESGQRSSITYAALYQRVAQLASSLRKDGVGVGDRVAGYVPNTIDTFVAMLATTSVGATWTSCSPDFGLSGVRDRFGQVEPAILFCADAYTYNGKPHSSLDRVRQLVGEISSIRRVVVMPFLSATPNISGMANATVINDYLDTEVSELDFVRVPFDQPVFIMYSSGTTGQPKCIVHSVGGALLKHQTEHLLHTDIKKDDVFFYYSTCGWMMWNWLASGLACGCTLMVVDGSPFYPSQTALIDLIDREKITVFGVSAKYLSAIRKFGLKPIRSHALNSLKTILSTGSPLSAEEYSYVYADVKSDVLLASISGGTDLLGSLVSGNPCLPVYPGELQCPSLAMAVDVVDQEGRSMKHGKGELVCRLSFPSMPVCFWNDPGNEKYHATYFSKIENAWAQGDFAEWTPRGGMIIHGRSDAVLNPGGVRIGTAEIYRQVERIEEVMESIAVGQEWKGDCRVILFVALRDGLRLDTELIQRIRVEIRTNATPRHMPSKVIQVAEIPRTRSGKIVEITVRDLIHGREVKNADALSNPETLDLFRDLPELLED